MMRFTQFRILDTASDMRPAARHVPFGIVKKLHVALALLTMSCAPPAAFALASPVTALSLPAITITAVTPQISENIKDIGNLRVERSQTQTLKIPSGTTSGYLSGPLAPLNTALPAGTIIGYIVTDASQVLGADATLPACYVNNTTPCTFTPAVEILLPNQGSILSRLINTNNPVGGGQALATFDNVDYTANAMTVSYSTSGSNDLIVPFFGGGSSVYLSGPFAATNTNLKIGDVVGYLVNNTNQILGPNSALPDCFVNHTSPCTSFTPVAAIPLVDANTVISVPGGASGFVSGPFAPLNTPLSSGDAIAYIVSSFSDVKDANGNCLATPPTCNPPIATITMPNTGTIQSIIRVPGAAVNAGDMVGTYTPDGSPGGSVLYIKKSYGAILNAGDTIGAYGIDGKAAPGVDFVPVSGLVTILAGQSSATFELIPQEDNDPTDGNEDVTLTISANSAYTVGTPGSAAITLVDGPFMSVTATDPIAGIISGQSPDPGTFTFSRTGDTTSALTVDFTLSGSAINGTDYATLPTQITIPAGQLSTTLTVTPSAGSGNQAVKTVTVDSMTLPLAAPSNTPSTAYLSGPMLKPSSIGKPIAYLVTSATDVVAANGCLCDLPADAVPVPLPQFGSGSTGQVTDISFTKNVGDAVASSDTIANLTVSTWATVAIAEGFISPSVDVVPNQGGSNQRYITVGGGNVTVTAAVTDLNPGETHTYDWSATDNTLTPLSGTTNSTFVFDPSSLTPGFYTLRVTVTDSSLKSTAGKVLINVVATLPDLDKDTALDNASSHAEDAVDDVEDSDGDGIPDATEGYTDTNNNGIPDYLYSSKLSNNEIPEVPLTSDQFLIVTEPDYEVRLGDVAFASGNAGTEVSLSDIAQYGGPGATAGVNTTDTLTALAPYEDFTITGLFQEGDTAKVVVPQQDAVPAGARYRVYHPSTGWQDFVVDANNAVASCCTQASLAQNNSSQNGDGGNHGNYPGSNGNCPAPGSSDYQPGLAQGSTCVELTIQDGGPNDIDGVADHVITDPSVVAYDASAAAAGASSSSSSGGGVITLPSLLALLGFYITTAVRRRARWKRPVAGRKKYLF